MKKTVKYLLLLPLLLSVVAGCVKETPVPDPVTEDNLPFPEGEKAVLHMSVRLPIDPETKAMDDQPQVQNLRVVIFGSSGFLKESVDAEDLQLAETNGSNPVYSFTVRPSLTDSKNLRIHIIANCTTLFPWKYEDVVMSGSAYTQNGQDAYWARFVLPNGITPRKEYVDSTQTMEYVKEGIYYKVTQDVIDAFTAVPLIRNFAKISVESITPQLVLDPTNTMAMINVPDRGSVAPYDVNRSLFMDHYKDSTYAKLKASYPGFSPPGTGYLNTNPDAVTFHSCTRSGSNIIGGIYMYERPAPTSSSDTPTYMIIKGTYYPLKDGKTANDLADAVAAGTDAALEAVINYSSPQVGYYKIDLMDGDGYYAVLRNFRYHIRISGVSKPGAATPGQAGSTGGGGDISSSTATANLTDISDGYGRIAVSFVEMTIVEQKAKVELKYKFIPSVDAGDTPDNRLESEDGPVTITIGTATGPTTVFSSTFGTEVAAESGVTVGDNTKGKIKVLSALTDNEGYRTIHFTTNLPDASGKAVQKIRITGKIDEFKTIYREITFNLMEKQTMTVTCRANEPDGVHATNAVESVTGKGVNVDISIPILLPESMFPLVFNLESSELSITPNTRDYPLENLPVEGGASIWKTGKQAFHYKRTLSYEEYKALPAANNGTKTFTCHFKTNRAQSASTVYVTNDYFNMGSGAFTNYTLYNFKGGFFSNLQAGSNTNLTYTFTLDDDDSTRPRAVTVVLDGLVPQNVNDGWTVLNEAEGMYSVSCANNAGAKTVTLQVKTLPPAQHNGDYGVTLMSGDYHTYERFNSGYVQRSTTITGAYLSDNLTSGQNRSIDWTTAEGESFHLDFSRLNSVSTGNDYIELYANSSMTITGSALMTAMTISYTGNYYSQCTMSPSSGSYTRTNNTTGSWTGSTASLKITMGNAIQSGWTTYRNRITGITITYWAYNE